MRPLVASLLALLALSACAHPGAGPARGSPAVARPAPPRSVARPAPPRSPGLAAELAAALVRRLTLGARADGSPVFPAHCDGAPGGCPARLRAFARILAEAGARHGVDPFLLAGLAMRESSLDPGALGRLGEAGIVQLHPRGEGHDVRFVLDAAYRRRCLGREDGCQGPVVERAAEALARSQRQCGSMTRALARYASGRCDRGLGRVARVLEERDRIREAGRQARAD